MKYTAILIALLMLVPAVLASTFIIPQSSEPTHVTTPSTYIIQHSDINTKGLDTRSLIIPGKSGTAATLELLRQRKAERDAAGYNSEPITQLTYANPGPQIQDTNQDGYGNGAYYMPNTNRFGSGYGNYGYPGTYESCDITYAGSPFYASYYTPGLGFPFSYSFSSSLYGRNPYLGNGCQNGVGQYGGHGYGGYDYQWYYFANNTYTQCTRQDQFNRYDCSYRFDGRNYFYDNPTANELYYSTQYDLGKIDISDRFALINGRYVLCPQRAFDHDECVFYYKGGKWYYDDPSDNDFSGIPNIEMDTDLDRNENGNTTNQSNQSNQNNNQSNNNNNAANNNQNNANNNYNSGTIYGASYVNYKAYVDQYPKFNYVNGQFVSCTSSCIYYARNGVMFTIDSYRYAQG